MELVKKYDSDRYVKSFYCWNHLLAMIYCQLTNQNNLRDFEISFNSSVKSLGIYYVKRSTLSEANERRDPAVFKDLFLKLVSYSTGRYKKELKEVIEVVDSTPIQLKGLGYEWTKATHRVKGLKTHVVYNLGKDFTREEFYSEFGEGATFPQVVVDDKKLGGCNDTVNYLKEQQLV